MHSILYSLLKVFKGKRLDWHIGAKLTASRTETYTWTPACIEDHDSGHAGHEGVKGHCGGHADLLG